MTLLPRYVCRNPTRRAKLQNQDALNGIDYLEVDLDKKRLLVHFFHDLPPAKKGVPKDGPTLGPENVVIEGGTRVRGVRATKTSIKGKTLTVHVDSRGDYSRYTLHVVSAESGGPPDGFDPVLSRIEFSFKVDCPSEFDCAPDDACPPGPREEPAIDYLAKDYATFRRLMLDRMALLAPGWTERNAADVGVALVEAVAFEADRLSYHQDAVATEAYLGTARRRVSVRRHARLLDHRMHEGCNARAWIAVEVAPGVQDARLRRAPGSGPRTVFTTRFAAPVALDDEAYLAAVDVHRPVFFEPLHDAVLYDAHNEIAFHDWEDEECCLPRGATAATLVSPSGNPLRLRRGDVLVFEEVRSPRNGLPEDADPVRRHAVRLTRVDPEAPRMPDGWSRGVPTEKLDPLTKTPIVDVEWAPADALPFPLCLSSRAEGVSIRGVSVARGNVVLADHGLTLADEKVDPPRVPASGPYRPVLLRRDVTHREPFEDALSRAPPAALCLAQDPRKALPDATLRTGDGATWTPQADLVDSGRFAEEFVLEVESDGSAQVRFGDGLSGRKPPRGAKVLATYRVGNGAAGNVGAESVAHVGPDVGFGVVRVRNPLPASGGVDPEPLERVRVSAPQAFRTQERAVTELDHAEVAQRHPEVQRALATRRWTGSWFTTFLTVDRRGGRPVDAAFERELRGFLDRFRLAGNDLEIEPPRFVPIEIVMSVCVHPDHHAADVKLALLDVFSDRDLPDGRRGFFHPDRFTFGDSVWLSQVVAEAMKVPGVRWVDLRPGDKRPNRFQRYGEPDRGEHDEGRIAMERLEIPRLDNDPSEPENGRIDFVMEGGR